MRISSLVALIAICFFAGLPTEALAGCKPKPPPNPTICATQACDTLGASMMDGDLENLIACLNSKTGPSPQWKTLSGVGTAAVTPNPNPAPFKCPHRCPTVASYGSMQSGCQGQCNNISFCRAPGRDGIGPPQFQAMAMIDYPCNPE